MDRAGAGQLGTPRDDDNARVPPDPTAVASAIRATSQRLGDLVALIARLLLDALTNPHDHVAENELLAVRAYLVTVADLLRELGGLVGQVESVRDARRP